ncbi:MAG TPA: hypothetical protein DCO70_06160 [Verrucomicrobiales bacterium]|nr:hypothetical protein [Verrucomicrobiales bacterium]
MFLIYGLLTVGANSQTTLDVNSASFEGVLHDNLSNKKRQGSGFAPLILKSYPGANLFRDDAVGVNFEHIFNGAKEQNEISMFTPRHDPCELKKLAQADFKFNGPRRGPDGEWKLGWTTTCQRKVTSILCLSASRREISIRKDSSQ